MTLPLDGWSEGKVVLQSSSMITSTMMIALSLSMQLTITCQT